MHSRLEHSSREFSITLSTVSMTGAKSHLTISWLSCQETQDIVKCDLAPVIETVLNVMLNSLELCSKRECMSAHLVRDLIGQVEIIYDIRAARLGAPHRTYGWAPASA